MNEIKKIRDTTSAAKQRSIVAAKINEICIGYKLKPVHTYWKIMDNSIEGIKNNISLNRIKDVCMEKGMGLDYEWRTENSSKMIMVAIRFFTDPSLYYKLPSGVDMSSFIESTLKYYYFLIVDHDVTEYRLISVKELLKFSIPILEESSGNKNRINFRDKSRKLIVPADLEPTSIKYENYGFHQEYPNLISQLKQILS